MKYYHPAAFYCALLNNQPMGFWPPAILVRDAQRHGIEVLSVDITRSLARCRTDGRRIRLGMNYITGLGEQGIQRIINARQSQSFAAVTRLLDDAVTFDPAAPQALVAEMERKRPGAPLSFMIGLSASAVAAELRADRQFFNRRE